jgi:hypothetical protein
MHFSVEGGEFDYLSSQESEGDDKTLPYQDPGQEYQGRFSIQFWFTCQSHNSQSS